MVLINESSIYLHCTGTKCWSHKGGRATEFRVASKGANLQLPGAVSAHFGAILFEHRRSPLKKVDHDEWVLRVIEKAQSIVINSHDLVIVIDIAPSQRDLEVRIRSQLLESEAKILRLAPYSTPLNPIELVWNQVKSYIKRQIARSITLITNIPTELSQAEHRFALMENWSNGAFAFVTVQSVFESDTVQNTLTQYVP